MAKTRHRSPAYPAVHLQQAIEYAQAIYDADRRNLVPVPVAIAHLGFVEGSSQGLRAIAALKQFGLLEEEGKKEDRRVRLTERALDVLIAPSADDPGRLRAIRRAALEPTIHAELWEQYNGELPSDATIRAQLVRHREFNETYVDRFIQEFRDTIAFAKLQESDTIPEDDTDVDDIGEDAEANGGDSPPLPPPPKKETRLTRSRAMSTGLKEDVYSLDQGAVIVQWPEHIEGASKDDIDGWLKLVASKIKRAVGVSRPDGPDSDSS